MAITNRRPPTATRIAPVEDQEHRIEAFIQGASQRAETKAEIEVEPEPGSKRVRVMMRFDPVLLRQIDEVARRRGVSRTAWIHMVVSRALEHGEG